jgi:hypothetical protein
MGSADAICFPSKRIAFWNADGKAISGNTRGQMFLYFGHDRKAFRSVFGDLGVVI